MTAIDLDAVRADQRLFDEVSTDSRRIHARPILAVALASHTACLCDEVEQLRDRNRALEQLATDTILTTRPALPYRSRTVDGLSGVTLTNADGHVVIDGLAHTPAAALELSAAIARAATTPARKEVQP